MEKENTTPPANTRWIMRGADLSPFREPAKYAIIATDGSTKEVVLRKRQRQVVDLLTQGPVYCASPVRLSDIVHILKREIGLEVETEMYPGNEDSSQFGVYFLKSKVVRIADERVAA